MSEGAGMFGEYDEIRDWFKLIDACAEVEGGVPCEQAPDLYFPERAETGQYELPGELALMNMAKDACLSCPVMQQCGMFALKWNKQYGVWGGMSANDRRKIHRRNGNIKAPKGGRLKAKQMREAENGDN